MKIKRTRYCIMNDNHTEILCMSDIGILLIPLEELHGEIIKTYSQKCDAESDAKWIAYQQSWSNADAVHMDIVEVTETIEENKQ